MQHTSGAWKERLIAAGLGILCVLAVGEIGLRVFATLHPLIRAIHPTHAAISPDGHARHILCAGDSFTAGIGATSPQTTYPGHLERLMRESGISSPFTVDNLGIPGANTTMVLESLENVLSATDPALIIVLVSGTNDANYVGYARHLERSSALRRFEKHLYRARLFRLVQSVVARLERYDTTAAAQVSRLSGPPPTADIFVQWHRKRHPDEPIPPAFLEGTRWIREGDLSRAMAVFEAGLRANPENGALLFGAGLVHRLRLESQPAEEAFRRAVRAEPDNPAPYYALAEIRIDKFRPVTHRNLDAPRRWLMQGIERTPQAALLHCGLGLIAWHEQRAEAALAFYLRGIALDPSEPRCYGDLPAVTKVLGKRDEVVAALSKYAGRSGLAHSYQKLLSSASMKADIDAWVKGDLAEMVELARRKHIPIVLLTYPNKILANERLRRVARDLGGPLVDNERVFARLLNAGIPHDALFIEDGHCTSTGYAVMAGNVASKLAGLNLVPPSPVFDPDRAVRGMIHDP